MDRKIFLIACCQGTYTTSTDVREMNESVDDEKFSVIDSSMPVTSTTFGWHSAGNSWWYWLRGENLEHVFSLQSVFVLGSLGFPQKVHAPKERNEVAPLVVKKGMGRRSPRFEPLGPRGRLRKIFGVFILPIKNSVIGVKIIFLRQLIRYYVLDELTSFQVNGSILWGRKLIRSVTRFLWRLMAEQRPF